MAARGYTTVDHVQKALGLPLSGERLEAVQQYVSEVESYIDSLCRRSWLRGTITDEVHWYPSGLIYVVSPPIAALTSVKARSGFGESDVTLVDGSDYELRDAEVGSIFVSSVSSYDRIKVSYVQSSDLPDDIRQLATELVVIRAQRSILGLGSDVQGATFGGDSQVQFLSLANMPYSLRLIIEANGFEASG